MTPKGVEVVRSALKEVHEKIREVFRPIEDFYRVKMEDRLSNDQVLEVEEVRKEEK